MELEIIQIVIGIVIGSLTTSLWFILNRTKIVTSNAPDELLQKKLTNLEIEKGTLSGELNHLSKQLQEVSLKRDELIVDIQELISENGQLLSANKSLSNQYKESLLVQESFKKEFELIASRILQKNSESFNQTSQRNLQSILDPFREKISELEKEISDKYINEAKDKASLKTEIIKLVELNTKLTQEASHLTNALKGNNKQQGNWGEVILEKVLERSGLEKGAEFITQQNIKTEDGASRIPDAIIYLPEEKHIIIDSKVSLVAYERMVNSESEIEKQKELKLHLISLKSHIKELSDKKYFNTRELNSPEFTLLFLPIEASFSVALKEDSELFHYAWDRNIILVSPTTLLATLRTVASIWKHEKQTKHVLEIAKEGGALHDKFVAFVDDLQKIEKGIHQSQAAYSTAFNKLSSGKGNLVNRTNKLKILGAKAQKALSSDLIEQAHISDLEPNINE
ncbi:MAG: DNA recombination protein RmuC [Salibacteraceae bacterium]